MQKAILTLALVCICFTSAFADSWEHEKDGVRVKAEKYTDDLCSLVVHNSNDYDVRVKVHIWSASKTDKGVLAKEQCFVKKTVIVNVLAGNVEAFNPQKGAEYSIPRCAISWNYGSVEKAEILKIKKVDLF